MQGIHYQPFSNGKGVMIVPNNSEKDMIVLASALVNLLAAEIKLVTLLVQVVT